MVKRIMMSAHWKKKIKNHTFAKGKYQNLFAEESELKAIRLASCIVVSRVQNPVCTLKSHRVSNPIQPVIPLPPFCYRPFLSTPSSVKCVMHEKQIPAPRSDDKMMI